MKILMTTIEDWIWYLTSGLSTWIGALILFFSSIIEYIFPPFPGDTVTLAGAFVSFVYDFPILVSFTAVFMGSTLGVCIDFYIGSLLKRGIKVPIGIVHKAITSAERVSEAFARYGEAYIMVNRFLPGVRAFILVAAGMGGMRFSKVLLFGSISNLLWNTLVFAIAGFIGSNLDLLKEIFTRYSTGAWLLVFLIILALAWRVIKKRQ